MPRNVGDAPFLLVKITPGPKLNDLFLLMPKITFDGTEKQT
jgi:hypothetical protein